ncbi:alternate-type signal peptide domain-containing protein [Georgenia sp. EYE_87]|uniref:alternate-type signal peptide domain-containing protein n=1 Tax=Georgenia sp. EYE_87 TaxID=2853448 RepID=UPI0020050B9D|nr:alternate-type signal peptide domain-containing protein [Georgenia sp. EYE_87]MCK6210898.1 alternate-type signal peptide domain-containing protein [Georgenia sp. EYE_87]
MSSNAEAPRSRSKLTKALVATGVGVALLAGGGGTFATWYDSTTTQGTTITSGDLGLGAGEGDWFNSSNEAIDIDQYRVVPGEKLVFRQIVTIHATGDQLTAVLKPSFSNRIDGGNELSKQLEATAKFAVGTDIAPTTGRIITAADDGATLAVTLEVTFLDLGPRANGTTAQEQSAALQNITIELEQTALTADPAATAAPGV